MTEFCKSRQQLIFNSAIWIGGVAAEHDAIKKQLEGRLAANPSLVSLSEQCPLCGCPIIVSR